MRRHRKVRLHECRHCEQRFQITVRDAISTNALWSVSCPRCGSRYRLPALANALCWGGGLLVTAPVIGALSSITTEWMVVMLGVPAWLVFAGALRLTYLLRNDLVYIWGR